MDIGSGVSSTKSWDTSLPDWENRIVNGASLIPKLPLFDVVADKALRIFCRLKVPDMIGTPTYGEVCEKWILDFVRVIFGSYNPETKKRMLREFFLLVPKKNGKSAIAAAIIVTAAILNERPQAELVLIAPTQKIANIAFKQAAGIIALDEDLRSLFKVKNHIKEIYHLTTQAVIMILSADGDVVTGSKATYVLVDETHVLASKNKAPDIFLELRGGLASRPEGFMLQITTQSKGRPSGQFQKELQRARDVRDGKVKLPLLAVLYELPEKMVKSEEWRKEKTWGLVNPNLDRSVSIDYLRDKLVEADRDGPDAIALFASQHFNVEIGIGLGSGRWVGADYWLQSAKKMTLQDILSTSEVCVVGVDGGGLDDLLGLAVIGRHAESKIWQHWGAAWADRDVLELRKSIAPELESLAAAGELTLVDNIEEEAIPAIVQICEEISEAGLFPDDNGIGMDPEGVGYIIDALIESGFEIEDIASITQGYKLNAAIKASPVKLKNGTMVHCGQRLMTWCVENAKTEPRGNAVIVTKAQSGSAKIDPVMAMFDAVQLMSWNPVAGGRGLDDFLSNPVMAV